MDRYVIRLNVSREVRVKRSQVACWQEDGKQYDEQVKF